MWRAGKLKAPWRCMSSESDAVVLINKRVKSADLWCMLPTPQPTSLSRGLSVCLLSHAWHITCVHILVAALYREFKTEKETLTTLNLICDGLSMLLAPCACCCSLQLVEHAEGRNGPSRPPLSQAFESGTDHGNVDCRRRLDLPAPRRQCAGFSARLRCLVQHAQDV